MINGGFGGSISYSCWASYPPFATPPIARTLLSAGGAALTIGDVRPYAPPPGDVPPLLYVESSSVPVPLPYSALWPAAYGCPPPPPSWLARRLGVPAWPPGAGTPTCAAALFACDCDCCPGTSAPGIRRVLLPCRTSAGDGGVGCPCCEGGWLEARRRCSSSRRRSCVSRLRSGCACACAWLELEPWSCCRRCHYRYYYCKM